MEEVSPTSEKLTDKPSGLLALLDELEKQGADNAEITQRMNRYISVHARQNGIPIHGLFELTPLCNLDCKMCYVHLNREALQKSGGKMLTADQWIRIMEQAINGGMLEAVLTGGEALTHPDFDKIFLYLQNHGVQVILKTNGRLLTKERVDFFSCHPPKEIQITLYGADEETYEKVTGHRCFQDVMEAIQRVKSAGLFLSISITPNHYMKDNIEGLLNLVNSLETPYLINSELSPPRQETGRNNDGMDLTLDEYMHLYKVLARLKNRQLKPQCENREEWKQPESKPILGLPCGGGRDSFAVRWDGRMYPCTQLNDGGLSLLEEPFQVAWNAVHEAVQKHTFPGECLECERWPLCPPCVLLHENGGESGHVNPAICQRAERLLAEGLATIE